jgi:hypothetical protein
MPLYGWENWVRTLCIVPSHIIVRGQYPRSVIMARQLSHCLLIGFRKHLSWVGSLLAGVKGYQPIKAFQNRLVLDITNNEIKLNGWMVSPSLDSKSVQRGKMRRAQPQHRYGLYHVQLVFPKAKSRNSKHSHSHKQL